MATEILRPQDCLLERIRVPPASFSRRRSYGSHSNYHYYYHSNHHAVSSRSSRKPVTRPDQRKRVVAGGSGQPAVAEAASVLRRTSSADDSRLARSSGFVIEKVTILRRGQSLDSAAAAVNGDMYAGSAFAVSPSPSALPLPSFPTKKQSSRAAAAVDDSATRDLRRLLRLE